MSHLLIPSNKSRKIILAVSVWFTNPSLPDKYYWANVWGGHGQSIRRTFERVQREGPLLDDFLDSIDRPASSEKKVKKAMYDINNSRDTVTTCATS